MEKKIEPLAENGIFALEQRPTDASLVIVLAHGINSDLTEDRSATKPGLFDLVVERARDLGFGTVRFDFRGHGKSAPVDGYVSVRSELADIRRVLGYVERSDASLVGIVAASFAACAVCAMLPELTSLRSLVLLNPVLRPLENFLEPGSAWARRSINSASLEHLSRTGSLLLDGEFPLGKDFVEDMTAFKPTADLEHYRGQLAMIHGTKDTYVPFAYTWDVARERVCQFVPIDGSEHGFGILADRIFVAEESVRFISWATAR